MSALVECRDLSAGYGGEPVLRDVTFSAGEGEARTRTVPAGVQGRTIPGIG